MPHMPLFQIGVIFFEYAVWLYSGMFAVKAVCVTMAYHDGLASHSEYEPVAFLVVQSINIMWWRTGVRYLNSILQHPYAQISFNT